MATTSKLARKEQQRDTKFKQAQPEGADDYCDGDDDKAEEEEDRDMLQSDDSRFLSDLSSDHSCLCKIGTSIRNYVRLLIDARLVTETLA